jgi:hypothetical protein
MALTPAQLVTLKNHINASVVPAVVTARGGGAVGRDDTTLAALYNANSTFVVYKTNVGLGEIGDKINGAELAGLSSLNTTRLQAVIMLSPTGYNPSLVDRRAFFDDIFSGAGGVVTRASLLTLWKRFAREVERVFATGTGSDAVPGQLVYEGSVTIADIGAAFNS